MTGKIAERWKIEAVLALVRATRLERFFVLGSERAASKTHRFMRSVGYDRPSIFREVRALRVENYSQGPLPDDKGRPHDVWVFGKYLASYRVYIKLVAFVESGEVRCLCVSFHEAERPLTFPYGLGR